MSGGRNLGGSTDLLGRRPTVRPSPRPPHGAARRARPR